MSDKLKKVACPTCQKVSPWSTKNESRPFCSPRCKLIDLGEWADEKHAIPGDPVNPRVSEDDESEH